MQHPSARLWFRITAFLLAAVCLGFGFLFGMNAVNCARLGFFTGDPVYQTTWQCAELVRSEGYQVIDTFRRNPEFAHWDRLLEGSNLRFIILDENTGDVKASYLDGLHIKTPRNLKDNIFLYQYDSCMSKGEYGTVLEDVYVCDYYFGTDAEGSPWSGDYSWNKQVENQMLHVQESPAEPVPEEPAAVGEAYQVLYILDDQIGYAANYTDSIAEGYRAFRFFRSQAEVCLLQFGVCALGFLLCAVFLVVTAGRRREDGQLQLSWFDRIPTDLLLAAGILAGLGMVAMAVLLGDMSSNTWIFLNELALVQAATSVGAAACGTVLLAVLCAFSVQIKAGTFWTSALTVRAVAWCWKYCKRAVLWLWQQVVLGVRSIGMVPRAALTLLGVVFVEFVLLTWLVNTWDLFFPLLFLLLFNLLLLFAAIWGVAQMRILQKAAQSLADGNLDSQLDTGRMYWEFRKHGNCLNAIAGGMNKAVEQRMKSERLKTELITNVSHDIKTPLTSIVNYVDLLQKPHTGEEQVQYLEVLDRQAKRLKRLTENLVEASKASTGNLPVELAPTSVLELLNQAVEEYRARLEAGKLEVVLDLRGDLTVQADGKHMWRILDNLLNNVIKYALPGTRVYVTAQKRADWVVIAVKNISRDPLNVEAEELMERFVRGDSSRTTEGSGLGLNIARSLTALQNGRFDLTVDGDLFKAEISLPAV